ncbi:MAG: hypothetical protein EPO57_09130 [Chitinophagaceae bacterium]|nr:MAG: hypothetical protein EPO57_09130 [Chitinophagaceae bacterium]
MRGRLINPFVAELAQLDTVATATDPDMGGPLTSGYDDVFKEVVKLTSGASARKEKPVIFVPCQVEVGTFEALAQLAQGNAPQSRVVLVFHFQDLELMGLVEGGTGDALIRVNDRLVSIRRYRDNALVQAVKSSSGGLFATESQPQSFGLCGGERNLLIVSFDEREQGLRTGG